MIARTRTGKPALKMQGCSRFTLEWLALSPPGVSFERVVMRPSKDPWKG